jgi:putative ABC transport system permease protein
MKFSRLLKMAISSVWSNKIRSFLTMLGIIIGISSVIVLVGIGEGTKQQVASQIESLGTNLITINITGNRKVGLSKEEIEELKTKPGIKDIAPALSQSNISIKANGKNATTSLEASTANYSSIRKITVSDGRFINDRDEKNRYKVAVIGVDVANNIFGTTNVVGEKLYVNGYEFSIVGVLESQGSTMNGSGDDKIVVPLSTAQRILKTTVIKTFYVEAENKDKVSDAMAYLQLFLNRKYNNDTNSYRVFDQTSLLNTANETNDSLTVMLSGVAAISLIVGGIGIMNIMLVSVIERTREIGIRKAIGAKRKTILMQFLIEAIGISSLGGIIGVLIGYLGGYAAEMILNIPIAISFNVVMLAFAFSAIVGIVFGMYPASKASKLNPIDALRFE